jgi:hypothetical protein
MPPHLQLEPFGETISPGGKETNTGAGDSEGGPIAPGYGLCFGNTFFPVHVVVLPLTRKANNAFLLFTALNSRYSHLSFLLDV